MDSIMNNENDNCRFYYLDFFKKKLTLKYDDKESDNEHDKHHNEEHSRFYLFVFFLKKRACLFILK